MRRRLSHQEKDKAILPAAEVSSTCSGEVRRHRWLHNYVVIIKINLVKVSYNNHKIIISLSLV
jgi:hypothetical protein